MDRGVKGREKVGKEEEESWKAGKNEVQERGKRREHREGKKRDERAIKGKRGEICREGEKEKEGR